VDQEGKLGDGVKGETFISCPSSRLQKKKKLKTNFFHSDVVLQCTRWYVQTFYFYNIFYFILLNTPSIPGKLNRGISVVDTVRILKGDTVTEDDIFKASILGWLIEFVSKIFIFFWGKEFYNRKKKGLICLFPLKK
jgi:hypothetical protein